MQKNYISAVGGAETLPFNQETRNQPEIADLKPTAAPASEESASPFDNLAIFPSTKKWMKRHSIMPAQWNLSGEEVQRISSAGIRITVYNTPATCLPLLPAIEAGLKYLIVVDPAPLESGKLTPRQMIASLLHELGHVVNLPIPGIFDFDYLMQLNGVKDEEVFADDYVRHCGYGIDFAEALEAMMEIEPHTFRTTAVNFRIKRIRENTQLNLNLLADSP